MATITKERIQCARYAHGSSPKSFDLSEGASQTFVLGELVFIEAGYVIELASDTPGVILGMAGADGHNDATAGTHRVSVYTADVDNVFIGNVLGASAADHVLLQSDLGGTMAIQRVTADSRVYLDASVKGGANTRVYVWDVAPGSNVSDTNARVYFSFLDRYAQFSSTS